MSVQSKLFGSLSVQSPYLGKLPRLIRLPPPLLLAYKPFYGSQSAFEKMILAEQNKEYLKSYIFQPQSLARLPEMSSSSFQEEDDEDDGEDDGDDDGDGEGEKKNSIKYKPLKLQKFTDEEVIKKTGFTISQICEFSLEELKKMLGFKTPAYIYAMKKIRRRFTNHLSYNRMKKSNVITPKVAGKK